MQNAWSGVQRRPQRDGKQGAALSRVDVWASCTREHVAAPQRADPPDPAALAAARAAAALQQRKRGRRGARVTSDSGDEGSCGARRGRKLRRAAEESAAAERRQQEDEGRVLALCRDAMALPVLSAERMRCLSAAADLLGADSPAFGRAVHCLAMRELATDHLAAGRPGDAEAALRRALAAARRHREPEVLAPVLWELSSCMQSAAFGRPAQADHAREAQRARDARLLCLRRALVDPAPQQAAVPAVQQLGGGTAEHRQRARETVSALVRDGEVQMLQGLFREWRATGAHVAVQGRFVAAEAVRLNKPLVLKALSELPGFDPNQPLSCDSSCGDAAAEGLCGCSDAAAPQRDPQWWLEAPRDQVIPGAPALLAALAADPPCYGVIKVLLAMPGLRADAAAALALALRSDYPRVVQTVLSHPLLALHPPAQWTDPCFGVEAWRARLLHWRLACERRGDRTGSADAAARAGGLTRPLADCRVKERARAQGHGELLGVYERDLPWAPDRHRSFPKDFRRRVKLLLLAARSGHSQVRGLSRKLVVRIFAYMHKLDRPPQVAVLRHVGGSLAELDEALLSFQEGVCCPIHYVYCTGDDSKDPPVPWRLYVLAPSPALAAARGRGQVGREVQLGDEMAAPHIAALGGEAPPLRFRVIGVSRSLLRRLPGWLIDDPAAP
eukprot:TRINITY_DN6950_c0_g3_i1.p1 TRINITY_DN6950_c0_g3~~TRINITY_DN6950_c0_g3_i1.p1  ORF type:complete len:697 (+),score=233.11 TRINITY_DN6950_c0_g3_i1:76-2091(+)